MIVATLAFMALAFVGPFTWWHGLILLTGLTLMLGEAAWTARCQHRDSAAAATLEDLEDVEGADPDMPWWQIVVFLLLGLAGLPLGADLLVDSSVVIARAFGVSETAIGLTLVAVGTSLPELATTVMAALRRIPFVYHRWIFGRITGVVFTSLYVIYVVSVLGWTEGGDERTCNGRRAAAWPGHGAGPGRGGP